MPPQHSCCPTTIQCLRTILCHLGHSWCPGTTLCHSPRTIWCPTPALLVSWFNPVPPLPPVLPRPESQTCVVPSGASAVPAHSMPLLALPVPGLVPPLLCVCPHGWCPSPPVPSLPPRAVPCPSCGPASRWRRAQPWRRARRRCPPRHNSSRWFPGVVLRACSRHLEKVSPGWAPGAAPSSSPQAWRLPAAGLQEMDGGARVGGRKQLGLCLVAFPPPAMTIPDVGIMDGGCWPAATAGSRPTSLPPPPPPRAAGPEGARSRGRVGVEILGGQPLTQRGQVAASHRGRAGDATGKPQLGWKGPWRW